MPFATILTPDVLYAAAAAACTAVVAAATLALAGRRARASREALAAASQQLAGIAAQLLALRQETGAQAATLVALAARLDGLQRDIASDARHAAPAGAGNASSAFELAIRLARGGSSVEELMSACMVTRHEAELALRLHGPNARAGAARLAAVR